jgi:hypothetical protein
MEQRTGNRMCTTDPLSPKEALELRRYKPTACYECIFMDRHDFKLNPKSKVKKTGVLAQHLCILRAKLIRHRSNHYIATYEKTRRPISCPIDRHLRLLIDTMSSDGYNLTS